MNNSWTNKAIRAEFLNISDAGLLTVLTIEASTVLYNTLS